MWCDALIWEGFNAAGFRAYPMSNGDRVSGASNVRSVKVFFSGVLVFTLVASAP